MRPPFVPTPRLGPTMMAIRRYFEEHRPHAAPILGRSLDCDALSVQLECCDPRAMVRRAVEDARRRASMRDARVHAEGVSVAQVYADSRRVLQVLSTLIEHCVDLARPGSEVVVTARNSARDVRFVVATSANGWLPDQIAPVFDQYHADAGGDLPGELYSCRQIVAAHHGRAGVFTVVGGSSTLWFTIPAAIESAAPHGRA